MVTWVSDELLLVPQSQRAIGATQKLKVKACEDIVKSRLVHGEIKILFFVLGGFDTSVWCQSREVFLYV